MTDVREEATPYEAPSIERRESIEGELITFTSGLPPS